MISSAFADAQSQFGAYALDFIALTQRPMLRLTAADIASLAEMVRDADRFLAEVAAENESPGTTASVLLDQVRFLRAAAAKLLAVAGPDATWGMSDEGPIERIILTEEESRVLGDALLQPSEPNEALRTAWMPCHWSAGMDDLSVQEQAVGRHYDENLRAFETERHQEMSGASRASAIACSRGSACPAAHAV